MRLPFAVAAVVAAMGVTGFMVAGVSRRPPPSTSVFHPGPTTAAREEPERLVDTSRLERGLGLMPREVASRRNPFRFAGARGAATRVGADADPAAGVNERIRPEGPPIQLLGIAEDTARDGTPARTAIVVLMNQVHLVKEGEQIALRFLVRTVGADVVEIEDLAEDTLLRLPLR